MDARKRGNGATTRHIITHAHVPNTHTSETVRVLFLSQYLNTHKFAFQPYSFTPKTLEELEDAVAWLAQNTPTIHGRCKSRNAKMTPITQLPVDLLIVGCRSHHAQRFSTSLSFLSVALSLFVILS
jgi:hypothetical protein